ncbi:hypothetical protein BC938DRAFT_478527 [Jimgerdemannia flammicorona]|uniref:Uncharacterized protein n=1 Tax=Jimgerdemannia flammicorona TaxID=994334 RepID=A0A433QY83_9FUNG|nr:hypothetical protein BC938DRAFT_478527 [Jimgerdemannia flammicorona]
MSSNSSTFNLTASTNMSGMSTESTQTLYKFIGISLAIASGGVAGEHHDYLKSSMCDHRRALQFRRVRFHPGHLGHAAGGVECRVERRPLFLLPQGTVELSGQGWLRAMHHWCYDYCAARAGEQGGRGGHQPFSDIGDSTWILGLHEFGHRHFARPNILHGSALRQEEHVGLHYGVLTHWFAIRRVHSRLGHGHRLLRRGQKPIRPTVSVCPPGLRRRHPAHGDQLSQQGPQPLQHLASHSNLLRHLHIFHHRLVRRPLPRLQCICYGHCDYSRRLSRILLLQTSKVEEGMAVMDSRMSMLDASPSGEHPPACTIDSGPGEPFPAPFGNIRRFSRDMHTSPNPYKGRDSPTSHQMVNRRSKTIAMGEERWQQRQSRFQDDGSPRQEHKIATRSFAGEDIEEEKRYVPHGQQSHGLYGGSTSSAPGAHAGIGLEAPSPDSAHPHAATSVTNLLARHATPPVTPVISDETHMQRRAQAAGHVGVVSQYKMGLKRDEDGDTRQLRLHATPETGSSGDEDDFDGESARDSAGSTQPGYSVGRAAVGGPGMF